MSVTEQMTAIADDAIRLAHEQYAVELDYSGESVAAVEEVLDHFRDSLPKAKDRALTLDRAARREISTMASLFGAYIGEVLRSEFGGEWRVQRSDEGEEVVLAVKDEVLQPPGRVFQRLLEGSERDVWNYYQVTANRLRGGPPLVQIRMR